MRHLGVTSSENIETGLYQVDRHVIEAEPLPVCGFPDPVAEAIWQVDGPHIAVHALHLGLGQPVAESFMVPDVPMGVTGTEMGHHRMRVFRTTIITAELLEWEELHVGVKPLNLSSSSTITQKS